MRETWSRRVSTGELNRWFERAVEANPPPAPGGKRIKLRYITQVKTRPPSFVVFGTRVDQLPDSYRRYLLNSMRRDLEAWRRSAAPDHARAEEPVSITERTRRRNAKANRFYPFAA